jgi:phytoene synthase
MAGNPNKAGIFINGIDITNIDKHPNILIAASYWEEDRQNAAKICYRFMREIDDLVDDEKSRAVTLSCLEKQLLSEKVDHWIRCLDKHDSNDPFIQGLIDTIDTYKIPLLYFHNFAIAMQYDINHNGFPSFQSFLDYAEGASVAPASIFVHLCCLRKENGSFLVPPIDIQEVARPCAIFSYLVHVIRDFQKDQKENLNYFALDILHRNDLTPENLKEIAKNGDIPQGFKNVIRFYKDKAEEYRLQTLEQIECLENLVSDRYMKSLKLIYKLYLAVYNRIDVENGTYTTEELTPSLDEVIEMME